MKEIDSDQNSKPEVAECRCADDLWDYIEAHEDELENLEDYARRRGFTAVFFTQTLAATAIKI